jgi:hypothetical protein
MNKLKLKINIPLFIFLILVYHTLEKNEKSLITINEKCLESNCHKQGHCSGEGPFCVCNHGYATFPANLLKQCMYRQKDYKKACLLEMLGLGIGHYYTSNYTKFTYKVILFTNNLVLLFCFSSLVNYLFRKFDNILFIYSCLIVIMIFALAYMYLYIKDLIYYGNNWYLDGNNVSLVSYW